jgi:AmiR/NasT family two-component response regulator
VASSARREAEVYAALSRIALRTRTLDQVLHQAQGVLVVRLHCSRDQGFAALIRLAEGRGLRLHQAAQVVVDQTAD